MIKIMIHINITPRVSQDTEVTAVQGLQLIHNIVWICICPPFSVLHLIYIKLYIDQYLMLKRDSLRTGNHDITIEESSPEKDTIRHETNQDLISLGEIIVPIGSPSITTLIG